MVKLTSGLDVQILSVFSKNYLLSCNHIRQFVPVNELKNHEGPEPRSSENYLLNPLYLPL